MLASEAPAHRRLLRLPLARGIQALYPLFALAILLLAWEAAVRILETPEYILPPPSAIGSEIYSQHGLLLHHSWVTLVEILLGFALSIAVALPLAVLIVYSRFFERVFYPLLVSSQTIPKVAIAPLFVFWFGLGLLPKVLIAFLVAFFPLVISSVIGMRSTSPEMIYLVRSMGAGTIKTFVKARFPNALPSIFGGLKVAITLSVIGAIVGEFVGTSAGLGYLVVVAQGNLQSRLIFAAITMMAIIGVVLFYIVELIERVVLSWHISSQRDHASLTP